MRILHTHFGGRKAPKRRSSKPVNLCLCGCGKLTKHSWTYYVNESHRHAHEAAQKGETGQWKLVYWFNDQNVLEHMRGKEHALEITGLNSLGDCITSYRNKQFGTNNLMWGEAISPSGKVYPMKHNRR
jgi:hypothetical protein